MSKKFQAGETIIEVLVAISVIAATIGVSFAIANRSQKTVQADQERYTAQLLANGQADSIRAYIGEASSNRSEATLSSPFCMVDASPQPNTNPECTVNNLYAITVTRTSNSTSFSTFNIKVEWDSITGNGKDKVELNYGT